jgi:hypothetical protein
VLCCSYRYTNLADADEFAFAASIALQAFFEGRPISSKHDMDRCVYYWRSHIAEKTAPVERKRPVCCEDTCTVTNPWNGLRAYKNWTHPKRNIPYSDNSRVTPQLVEAYANYERLRTKQIHHYDRFIRPTRTNTVCKIMGCRRLFGRRGCCFCTEDCDKSKCCSHQKGQPAPPFSHSHNGGDWDDDNDAARILMRVLGPPPTDVLYTRYEDKHEEGGLLPTANHANAADQMIHTNTNYTTADDNPDPDISHTNLLELVDVTTINKKEEENEKDVTNQTENELLDEEVGIPLRSTASALLTVPTTV